MALLFFALKTYLVFYKIFSKYIRIFLEINISIDSVTCIMYLICSFTLMMLRLTPFTWTLVSASSSVFAGNLQFHMTSQETC